MWYIILVGKEAGLQDYVSRDMLGTKPNNKLRVPVSRTATGLKTLMEKTQDTPVMA
jgi:hypothetical protein